MLKTAIALDVLNAALRYSAQGISVLPVEGKRPALANWKERQEKRASSYLIQHWHKLGILKGVGIVCGRVSRNLIVIDCDGEKAVATYKSQFPHLLDTYTVISGSGLGAHFYYYTETLPPTTRVTGAPFGNIELRSDGCYVVAPPSIHPVSGQPYRISNEQRIKVLHHARDIVNWIKTQIAEKHGGKLPAPSGNFQPVRNASAYGRAALHNAMTDVRNAQNGNRNNALNRAAFKLGKLVATGQLNRADVEHALFHAAASLVNEDGDKAVLKTINSGLNAGQLAGAK